MPESSLPNSDLYSGSAEPTLNGAQCRACGYIFFPPQWYGCEVCGAGLEQLESKSLAGQGNLSSFATVHLHQGKGIEAPFTVAVIVLDDGPAIRAVLTEKTDAGLKIGDNMRAVLVAAADDAGALVKELRFAKQETTR